MQATAERSASVAAPAAAERPQDRGNKVVLAYSGGLDTSVCIRWLAERYGAQVVTVVVDVGGSRDISFVREKALSIGAAASYAVDARDEFLRDFVFRALKANALYEGKYPLSAALSRPLISRILVEIAEAEGAGAVAHGCTGKGNDQVRFDVSVAALNPGLKVVAPVREWPMSREDEIEYAREHGIPVPVTVSSPYSIDENLWGRSIECGVIEDAWQEPPQDAFAWTLPVEACPEAPCYVEIGFERGVPVSLNGESLGPVELVSRLNLLAGTNGVGRIDQIENRLVGIKSREVYEAPAAVVLTMAHKDLESLTLTREVFHYKASVDASYAELAYFGLWFSPLRRALDAFVEETQRNVTGVVRVRLVKGNATVVGRRSPCSLYDKSLATYTQSDSFDHTAAEGFIKLWGLPTRVAAAMERASAERAGEKKAGPGGPRSERLAGAAGGE